MLVNELNTLPGMTPTSAFPKLWEATGVPWPQAVDRLLAIALERHAADRRHRTSGARAGAQRCCLGAERVTCVMPTWSSPGGSLVIQTR